MSSNKVYVSVAAYGLSWTDAEDAAIAVGSHLASINSSDELNAV